MNIAEEIIQDIAHIIDDAKEIVVPVITDADKVVNMLMAFENSPTGQMIIAGLAAIFPEADPAIDAISLSLPVIAKDMKWALNVVGKSDDAIFQSAWDYLKNLTGSPKAAQLNSLAALVGEILNGIKEGTLTIQQLLSLQQGAHAPLIVK